MHEVSIASEIIEIVNTYLKNGDKQKVKFVKIELGEFSNIFPDALKFGYNVLINETPLKNSELFIDIIPMKIRCIDCESESLLDDPLFFCPKCESANVKILSGTEMKITEIELFD